MCSSDNSTIDFNKFIDINILAKWHIYCLIDITIPVMCGPDYRKARV
jgi:hypothetical protein